MISRDRHLIRKMTIGNQAGFITIDFMFALVMSIGFAGVFFAITVTLSLVEIAQYVTYSTSRAYAGAHESPGMQSELAMERYKELMALPAVKTFLGNQWIILSEPELGDFSSEYSEEPGKDNDIFVGAQIRMDARLLHLRVPFLGSTAEDSGVGKATLNSYLMREVSTQECRDQFTTQRYKNLLQINGAPYQAAPSQDHRVITDNGC
jgi:hypothetical protein